MHDTRGFPAVRHMNGPANRGMCRTVLRTDRLAKEDRSPTIGCALGKSWRQARFYRQHTARRMSPIAIVGYLALFTGLGFLFLCANLVVGKFLRPHAPNVEKLEVYECGEPTIGSSFVQFDLRFYVVALLFIIFDVELAFFFPWGVVFGKATQLMDPNLVVATQAEKPGAPVVLEPAARRVLQDLGVPKPTLPDISQVSTTDNPASAATERTRDLGRTLAQTAIVDILVFFVVLMVGFAYVWMRGDLDWVRAVSRQRAQPPPPNLAGMPEEQEPALA